MAHNQPKSKYVCEGHISDKENVLKEVTNLRDLSNINMVLKRSTSSARQKPVPSLESSLMCSACVWKNRVFLKAEADQCAITWVKKANTGMFKGAFSAVSQSHPPCCAQLIETFPCPADFFLAWSSPVGKADLTWLVQFLNLRSISFLHPVLYLGTFSVHPQTLGDALHYERYQVDIVHLSPIPLVLSLGT